MSNIVKTKKKSRSIDDDMMRLEKKHGKDPMYQLVKAYLPVSLEVLQKKWDGKITGDNITHILKALKKMGFVVTKKNN